MDVWPVDAIGESIARAGAGDRDARPEMLVGPAVVVVKVKFGDAGLEELEGRVDAGARVVEVGEMGVADVEADANGIEVSNAEDFEEVLGCGDLVLEVLEEDLDTERIGEGFEVLDSGEGVIERARAGFIVLDAEVKDDRSEGDLFGGLDGALDLVHAEDAAGLFRVDKIEGGSDVAAPLGVGVERLMKGGEDSGVAKPGGDVAECGAVGVVEVMARGEDLNDGGAGSMHGVEEAGVEALLEEDVGGDSGLHCFSKLQDEGCG